MRLRASLALAVIGLLVIGVRTAHAEEPKKPAAEAVTRQQAQKAAERGLDFLAKDAAAWRKERECSTCHHGTMTVWAYSEAKTQGYAIDKEQYADVVKWTKDRLLTPRIDLPRDTRPGWSMVNTPAMYLAMMAIAVPKQDAVTAEELKKIAGHLLRHQEENGSWAWSSAPAKNRPPPHFESDEVASLLAYTVLGPHVPADAKEKSDVRNSRDKGAAWLAKEKPSDTTQALALRLFRDVRDGKATKELQTQIDALLARQNKDGGWGQLKDAASDAYATGQVLYFLNLSGVKRESAEIQRGVAFLVSTQKADGSWPMNPRSHAGAEPAKNTVPITYFGSAWGTLGLMRSVSK